MPKRAKIALLIESSREYGRGLLRGIAAYAQVHGRWSIYHHERALADAAPAWIKDWDGDGILARIDSRKLARQIRQARLPTVDLRASRDLKGILKGIPTVQTDQQAIVRMAVDHLLERKFEHFAYCGFVGVDYSEQRAAYFADKVARAGYEASIYEDPRPRTAITSHIEVKAIEHRDALAAWLESLPKPVGLMASNDIRAQQVLSTGGDCGIAVPDQLAVIGVDNDELICELCRPPLSSVELNPQKVGYEAAALLDRMLDGEPPPSEKTSIPPLGVITRQSTDVVAIADADVTASMHFIREHACDGIQVEDLLHRVQISRSTLERRFARLLGRSPKAEILRMQLEHVKQLLTRTDYPLAKIAQLTGFRHVENLCYLFKNRTGRTPGQYRNESQTLRAS